MNPTTQNPYKKWILQSKPIFLKAHLKLIYQTNKDISLFDCSYF